jgi:hypothetical protein
MVRTASTCRWACPTLYFDPPIWLYAWEASWTCLRTPRLLGSTEECAHCPRWEAPAEAARPPAHRERADSGR